MKSVWRLPHDPVSTQTWVARTDETKIGSSVRKVVTKVLKVGVVGANSGIK